MKIVFALAVVLASPVYAQTADVPSPSAAAPAAAMPNGTAVAEAKPKLICQDTETLGSRLGSHKVCMTKEQWRDQQRQTRMAVDRAQLSRGNSGN